MPAPDSRTSGAAKTLEEEIRVGFPVSRLEKLEAGKGSCGLEELFEQLHTGTEIGARESKEIEAIFICVSKFSAALSEVDTLRCLLN